YYKGSRLGTAFVLHPFVGQERVRSADVLNAVALAVQVTAFGYSLTSDHDKFVGSVLKNQGQPAAFIDRAQHVKNLKSCHLYGAARYSFRDEINPFQPYGFDLPTLCAQTVVRNSRRQPTERHP